MCAKNPPTLGDAASFSSANSSPKSPLPSPRAFSTANLISPSRCGAKWKTKMELCERNTSGAAAINGNISPWTRTAKRNLAHSVLTNNSLPNIIGATPRGANAPASTASNIHDGKSGQLIPSNCKPTSPHSTAKNSSSRSRQSLSLPSSQTARMLKCSVVRSSHKLDYDYEHEQEDEHEFVIRASSFLRHSSFVLRHFHSSASRRRPE